MIDKYTPVWIDGDVTVKELTDALAGIGLHVRTDGAGRIVAEPVPPFLRKDEPRSNVVQMPARVRKART